MIRRWVAVLGLLACIVYAVTADVGSGLYNRQHIAAYVFYRTDSTAVDTTESGAGVVEMFAFPTYYTDTTGHGIAATYSGGDWNGFWYWTNIATDIYDVYSDSLGTATLRADNILIMGRVLGDSMITDSTNFKASVITSSIVKDNSLKAADIAADAITASELAASAADSAEVANGAIHAGHLDVSYAATFFPYLVDSSMYGAVTWGFTAADTVQTVWKSGASTGDLVICGWAGAPQQEAAKTILGLSGEVTASKKVVLHRTSATANIGEHDAWFIVVGKP